MAMSFFPFSAVKAMLHPDAHHSSEIHCLDSRSERLACAVEGVMRPEQHTLMGMSRFSSGFGARGAAATCERSKPSHHQQLMIIQNKSMAVQPP
jgi:hypothetical protein